MLAGQLNALIQQLVQQGVMQPMPTVPTGKPN
jgi:hypothetical protein